MNFFSACSVSCKIICACTYTDVSFDFRANKTKIMEYLRESWANDRRIEWSIWMVHSKVEMPHHFISSRGDEVSLHGGLRGKVSVLRKLADDVIKPEYIRALIFFLLVAHKMLLLQPSIIRY